MRFTEIKGSNRNISPTKGSNTVDDEDKVAIDKHLQVLMTHNARAGKAI